MVVAVLIIEVDSTLISRIYVPPIQVDSMSRNQDTPIARSTNPSKGKHIDGVGRIHSLSLLQGLDWMLSLNFMLVRRCLLTSREGYVASSIGVNLCKSNA